MRNHTEYRSGADCLVGRSREVERRLRLDLLGKQNSLVLAISLKSVQLEKYDSKYNLNFSELKI